MPDKTSRALRRHHRMRLLKRAIKKHAARNWGCTSDEILWIAYRTWNNMKNCSCCGCCNERRNGWNKGPLRITMQERKSLQSFEQQVREVDNQEGFCDNFEL